MNIYPFCPAYGTNQAVTATDPAASAEISAQNKQVRVVNTGAAVAYVRTYPSSMTVAATATDVPVPPSMAVTITKDEAHDRISYFCATSTTLQIMTGEGF
jgi:predicted dinucleotide-utilizing enzyme